MPPITVRVIAATKSTVLPNARLIAIAAALSMAAQIPRNRQKKSARIFKKIVARLAVRGARTTAVLTTLPADGSGWGQRIRSGFKPDESIRLASRIRKILAAAIKRALLRSAQL